MAEKLQATAQVCELDQEYRCEKRLEKMEKECRSLLPKEADRLDNVALCSCKEVCSHHKLESECVQSLWRERAANTQHEVHLGRLQK